MLLAFYYFLASVASIIGLVYYDSDDKEWSNRVQHLGYAVLGLYEVCGSTAF